MASDGQVRHGALIGLVALLVCAGGILKLCGLLPAAQPQDASLVRVLFDPLPGEPRWAAPRTTVPIAVVGLAAIIAIFGGHALPWGILFALLVLAISAWRRPALLVFVVTSALYLPLLGRYGLWDPWETHYGEVAREMLSRDDWLSLWWAQDKWFWSKPIFIFWAEGLLWSASGLPYLPDTNFEHTEWVLRLPTFGVSMLGVLTTHAAIRRLVGERAGVLAALVLATMPYYGFLTHQAITDMPFVGTMTGALMLLLLAVHEDPEREAPRYRVGPLSISGHEVVLTGLLLICLAQVLYLAGRNITFQTADMLFAWHKDEFMFGSGHNPDVPGNFGIHTEAPRFASLWVQPLAQGLLWGLFTAFIVWRMRKERRAQALYMIAFYLLCGLSFMAKGIPGFALPGLVALLYLLCCNRWSLLLEGRLKVALGALTLLTASLPWFVAMYVRHGNAFTNRILIHDHLNRLTKGVHGDTGSIQYFIGQLGYGMFPWIALAPLALGIWFHLDRGDEPTPASRKRRETLIVIGLWLAAGFTLYSAMITKFHHYVFPVVPAAAVLIGVALDQLFGRVPVASSGRSRLAFALALLSPLPLVIGVGLSRGNIRGILPANLGSGARDLWVFQNGAEAWLWAPLCVIGLGMIVAAAWLQRSLPSGDDAEDAVPSAGLGAALLAGAALCAFVGRDLSWITAKRPAGYERLIHLFVYNYERAWPVQFDYRPILTGFAIVATALVAFAAWRALRPALAAAFLGLCLCFSLWTLNVYMIDLSPHWTQRELVRRYYAMRKGPKEPLVAWQMNWKGENYYTGNRVAVFVDLDNKALTKWMTENKGKTSFFVLEHTRLSRFKNLLSPRKVEELSTARDNNKFILVRAKL